ncbi:MAG: hypothetical protein HOP12_07475 [Candidatus Eisenbacteria bacterium]|uniref:Uncharacterized protein n=1 Tax=Eiseniibacteriota bacterium TaxID=2212470 RepID=A0A849SJY8_UNCEI|nr:hypothetical protein [Candidatus Eisenbacteria bacterium]
MPSVWIAAGVDAMPEVLCGSGEPMDVDARSRKRQPRDRRRGGGKVRLTVRDAALLRALGRFRIARSSDLGRLFFPGQHRDVLAARLRALFDAGFVQAHVLDRAAENIYSLGPAGIAWTRTAGATARAVPRQPWPHHLGIVRLWTSIASALHLLPDVRLTRCVPDWEVRAGAAVGLGVVPDALIELACESDGQERRVCLAVELDRGTESLEVLRRKVRLLDEARVARPSFLDWTSFDLVLVLDEAGRSREGKVRDLLAKEWGGPSRIWTPASVLADEIRSLVESSVPPVTDSRHCNGSHDDASRVVAAGLGVTGVGPSEDE